MVQKKSNSFGCVTTIFLYIIGSILIILLAKGCEALNSDKAKKETKPTVVVDGQNGFLIQDTFVAIDEESYDELFSYIVANNTNATKRMMESGRVIIGYKGERVTVLDSGFTRSRIEIISTGRRGYVPSEMVRSKIE